MAFDQALDPNCGTGRALAFILASVTVRQLRVVRLEVGKPAIFGIESLGGPDVAFTRRSTTLVLAIHVLEALSGTTAE